MFVTVHVRESVSTCVFVCLYKQDMIQFTAHTPSQALYSYHLSESSQRYAYGTKRRSVPRLIEIMQVFGRRVMILSSLFVFMVGAAICGAAQNMNMLISGRGMTSRAITMLGSSFYTVIHGAGSGGIASLCQISLSDLVTLKERGVYNGMFGLSVHSCEVFVLLAKFPDQGMGGGRWHRTSRWRCTLSSHHMALAFL